MLFLLSPAKALDYDTPAHVASHTQPLFTRQSAELIEVLKTQSPPVSYTHLTLPTICSV